VDQAVVAVGTEPAVVGTAAELVVVAGTVAADIAAVVGKQAAEVLASR